MENADDKITTKIKEQREKYAKKIEAIDENLKVREVKKAEAERKTRTKRIIEIGASVESVFEIKINKEELPQFMNFLREYKNSYFQMREKNISTPKKEEQDKIYLNVPMSEKEDAKELGARWDAEKKEWYILTDNPNKERLMHRWSKECDLL